MTAAGARRPFTGQEEKIAELIVTRIVENGEQRGLSYAEIGHELGLRTNTVRAYVRAMAETIEGLDALPPRTRIYLAVKCPEIAEVLRAELAD